MGAGSLAGAPAAQAAPGPTDRKFARIIRRRRSDTHRALVELIGRRQSVFAARDLPVLLGREASNPMSPLRQALSDVYLEPPDDDPRAGAGLLPPSTALLLWDDFERSDRTLTGDQAPSGHVYRTGGTPASNMLRGRRYAPQPLPQRASILYVEHARMPATIAAEFVWRPADTFGANVVLGACESGFGAGSIQLAVYSHRESRRDYDSSLFMVPSPISHPYPVLARGWLRDDFEWTMDGSHRYRVYLHRVEPDRVMLQLPDGQVVSHQDPVIDTYWGKVSGTQLRRPQASDGFAESTAIASSAAV